jgi:hypothetical protein
MPEERVPVKWVVRHCWCGLGRGGSAAAEPSVTYLGWAVRCAGSVSRLVPVARLWGVHGHAFAVASPAVGAAWSCSA